MADRAVEPRDPCAHGQHPARPQPHQPKRRPRQPEGRKQRRQRSHRHDQHPGHRHHQQVRQQAVMRHPAEMRRRNGRGRQPRHDRGQDQQHQRPQKPGQMRRQLLPGRIDHDQRHGGGKAHLETGGQQRLGRERQNRHGRQRHGPERQRPPVGQDRAQHDRDHQESPFRGHAAAREPQIARRRQNRDRGGKLMRRNAMPAPAESLKAHRQQPRRRIDEARQHPHMQPGDRDDVKQVRIAHHLVGGLGNAAAIPGHQRRRNRARLPADPGLHRRRQVHPQPVQAQRTPRRGRGRDHDRRARISDGAEAFEPGNPAEIEAARLGRARRRAEMAGQHDAGAGRGRLGHAVGQRNPDPARHPRGCHTLQPGLIQRQADAVAGGTVDLDHPPLDGAVIAKAQNRGIDTPGPQSAQAEAKGREDRGKTQKPQRICAPGPAPDPPEREARKQHQPRQRIGQPPRLRRQQEPQPDPARHVARHPWHQPGAFGGAHLRPARGSGRQGPRPARPAGAHARLRYRDRRCHCSLPAPSLSLAATLDPDSLRNG